MDYQGYCWNTDFWIAFNGLIGLEIFPNTSIFIQSGDFPQHLYIHSDLSSFQKIKPVWSVDIYKIKSYRNNFYTLEGLDKIYRREQLQPVDKDSVMKTKIKILDDKEYNDVEVIDNKIIVQNDIKEKRVRKPNSKYL